MAKVIIKVDNDIIANSIAIWFESGDAIAAWYADNEITIQELREQGEDIPDLDEYAIVEFGDPEELELVNEVLIYTE